MKIVPATEALLRRYYGDMPLPTMRAYVMLDGEEPVGVAGFARAHGGKRIIFSEGRDYVFKEHKVSIMKFGHFLMKVADDNGWSLIADPDANIITATKFLERLGFVENENGEYIR